ncbi:MAG TPA: hypothetical protein VFA28_01120 [Bryobacteraceae bacterium]|nr:hypothetical protein [Bryobacteraceae bacterium]
MKQPSGFTRRALLGVAAAAASAAQEPPPQAPPEQELNARRAQMKANFEQLSKTPLPMSIEPAFTFRA